MLFTWLVDEYRNADKKRIRENNVSVSFPSIRISSHIFWRLTSVFPCSKTQVYKKTEIILQCGFKSHWEYIYSTTSQFSKAIRKETNRKIVFYISFYCQDENKNQWYFMIYVSCAILFSISLQFPSRKTDNNVKTMLYIYLYVYI